MKRLVWFAAYRRPGSSSHSPALLLENGGLLVHAKVGAAAHDHHNCFGQSACLYALEYWEVGIRLEWWQRGRLENGVEPIAVGLFVGVGSPLIASNECFLLQGVATGDRATSVVAPLRLWNPLPQETGQAPLFFRWAFRLF